METDNRGTLKATPKTKVASKTWWGCVLVVVSAVALALSDGWQLAEDVPTIATAVSAALAGWGLRTAERPVR